LRQLKMSRLTVALRAKKFQAPWGSNYKPEVAPFKFPLGIQIDNAAGKAGPLVPPLISPKTPTGVPFIPPQPPGTRLNNWLFHYLDWSIGRLYERVGTYLYNRILIHSEFGLYSKYYNSKVHGPYCHWRWYGPADAKLLDVKLSELPAWLRRREYTPRAIWRETMRNVFRIHNLWYAPLFGPTFTTGLRYILAISFIFFIFRYTEYREANKKCYYNW
jgi:hypothetical protein